LGLAISKNIVEAHNGEIEVCRDVKVGAKILVRLPLTI
jgi:signal transduction histidine kinase